MALSLLLPLLGEGNPRTLRRQQEGEGIPKCLIRLFHFLEFRVHLSNVFLQRNHQFSLDFQFGTTAFSYLTYLSFLLSSFLQNCHNKH